MGRTRVHKYDTKNIKHIKYHAILYKSNIDIYTSSNVVSVRQKYLIVNAEWLMWELKKNLKSQTELNLHGYDSIPFLTIVIIY